jgi:hypothetical protein
MLKHKNIRQTKTLPQQKMKSTKPIIIQSLFVSAIFLITSLLGYKIIFSFFEPTIPGITFEIISNDRLLKTSQLFAIVMVCIPLMISLLLIALSLPHLKKIISLLIIGGCMSFAVFLRHQAVKFYFQSIVSKLLIEKNTTNFLYPIDPRNFVYFMIAGFLIGCLLSCLLVFGKNAVTKSGANR